MAGQLFEGIAARTRGPQRGLGVKNELPNLAESKLADAMALMQRALQLLDQTQAPADIGAHLDLAISRLAEARARAAGSQSEAELSRPDPIAASRSVG